MARSQAVHQLQECGDGGGGVEAKHDEGDEECQCQVPDLVRASLNIGNI